MSKTLKIIAEEIDMIIRSQGLWFDFHVYRYESNKLIIAGSIDLCYYHQLEIIFENIQVFHGFFSGWHSDTTQVVFDKLEERNEFNGPLEIEQGYSVFRFKTEDYQNDVIIAAEKISFNTDTVFYYERDDLKENERIAYFVKRS